MMKTGKTKFYNHTGLPYILAILAIVCYMYQSSIYAHELESNLDEGAYLYKGYLFVTGKYKPFQEYGTTSFHMPVSYLIPGVIQVLFGPGLEVGRNFMLVLAFFLLVGIWTLTNRLGGLWWATVAVWLMALNPIVIKMYSLAVSQGLVACMFIWVLVLTIGNGRPIWQIVLGSTLASLMVLTRINMILVLPLLVIYIFWQHGKIPGLLALIAIGITQTGFYAYYWPGILRIWARFIPISILEPWRTPSGATAIWNPTTPIENKWLSVFRAIRFHFVFTVGLILSLMQLPRKNKLISEGKYKTFIFLSALFVGLFVMHTWASVSQDYCVFCLEGYLAFFSFLGWLVLVISYPSWQKDLALILQIFVLVSILIIAMGTGFATFEDFQKGILDIHIPRLFIDFTQSATGSASLGTILENKFHIDERIIRRLNPITMGLFLGIGIILLALITGIVIRHFRDTPGLAHRSSVIFIVVGTLLLPTRYLGGGTFNYDCAGDSYSTYRATGEYLAKVIPENSWVYWDGGLSVVPLLYVPNIKIYPPQIDGDYSFYIGGEPEELLKAGLWNETIKDRWLGSANYILIEEQYYYGKLKKEINKLIGLNQIIEIQSTPAQVACRSSSRILVFQRIH